MLLLESPLPSAQRSGQRPAPPTPTIIQLVICSRHNFTFAVLGTFPFYLEMVVVMFPNPEEKSGRAMTVMLTPRKVTALSPFKSHGLESHNRKSALIIISVLHLT